MLYNNVGIGWERKYHSFVFLRMEKAALEIWQLLQCCSTGSKVEFPNEMLKAVYREWVLYFFEHSKLGTKDCIKTIV